jgi:triosephosphate isomerase
VEEMIHRKPFALANWKMAMKISESRAFVREFKISMGNLIQSVDTVLCPPFTALSALSQELIDSRIGLGAQNVHAATGDAHTGEISAPLLADAGCTWVLLGHWEIRRRTNETDREVNKKMHAGFQSGLRPILLIGESTTERGRAEEALAIRLPHLFEDCDPEQAANVVMTYEPEWSIGIREPASPEYVDDACSFIRHWIEGEYGAHVSNRVRIIYGGSVAPEHAENLLSSPNLDGLGAGRTGRDPVSFGQIVRLIVKTKGLVSGDIEDKA